MGFLTSALSYIDISLVLLEIRRGFKLTSPHKKLPLKRPVSLGLTCPYNSWESQSLSYLLFGVYILHICQISRIDYETRTILSLLTQRNIRIRHLIHEVWTLVLVNISSKRLCKSRRLRVYSHFPLLYSLVKSVVWYYSKHVDLNLISKSN